MWRSLILLIALPAAPSSMPVRTITAFVAVTPANAQARLTEAGAFLKSAKAEIVRKGWTVQTVRIATTPAADLVASLSEEKALALFASMDEIAKRDGFSLSVGPFAPNQEKLAVAMYQKTSAINASMRVTDAASARAAAQLIQDLSTQKPDGSQNFRFAAISELGPGSPFFPGGYASTSLDHSFALGAESAGVLAQPGALAKELAPLAAAGDALARSSGWNYLGIDTSPAPRPGNSIVAALEKRAGSKFGSPGTLAAAGAITAEIKAIAVRQTGYSGLMLPVLEDEVLAQRVTEGRVNVYSLLLYSAVCGTGLDTVPLPGDTPVSSVAALLEDVALLAKRWNKPLSVRLFLVPGKKAGDEVHWNHDFLVPSYRVMVLSVP